MENKIFILVMIFTIIIFSDGCKVKQPTEPVDTYASTVNGGWTAYKNKDYYGAAKKFGEALASDSTRVDAYIGAGWVLLKLDSLPLGETAFYLGSTKTKVTADLFAGWAFLLNATKQYNQSNLKTDIALSYDSTWKFTYDTTLSKTDLLVLKAENFFLLGDFNSSLFTVQILNPLFSTDISKPEGLAELATEIERLKKIM